MDGLRGFDAFAHARSHRKRPAVVYASAKAGAPSSSFRATAD